MSKAFTFGLIVGLMIGLAMRREQVSSTITF